MTVFDGMEALEGMCSCIHCDGGQSEVVQQVARSPFVIGRFLWYVTKSEAI